MKKLDLTDQVFGQLTAVCVDPTDGRSRTGWICECSCGNYNSVSVSDLRNGNTKSCGCLRREMVGKNGHQHRAWKGGGDGYIKIRIDTESVFEHRHVMEQKLGRKLLREETVHHKNGVRSDNHPRNLELWSKSHPPGQRVEDLVAWARQILATYTSP